MGHFELLWTFWIPATLLAFLRVVVRPGAHGWIRAAVLGVMVAAAVHLYLLRGVRHRGDGGDGGGAVAGAVASPRRSAAGIGRWHNDRRRRANGRAVLERRAPAAPPTCVRIFVTSASSRWHSLFRAYPPAILRRLQRSAERAQRRSRPPPGSDGLSRHFRNRTTRGGVFAWRRRDDRAEGPTIFDGRLALAIAASFLVLSLGSELKFRGNPTGLSLPAALLAHVPIVRLARAPGRQMVVAMLGVAVLVAAGWDRIARRTWRAILVAAVAFEHWASLPLLGTGVPDVYHRLAREPGSFAVMDVPVGARDGRRVIGRPSSLELLAQSVHQKPIIGGMASRLPADRWESILGAPLIGRCSRPMRKTCGSRKRKRRFLLSALQHQSDRGAPTRHSGRATLDRQSAPDPRPRAFSERHRAVVIE